MHNALSNSDVLLQITPVQVQLCASSRKTHSNVLNMYIEMSLLHMRLLFPTPAPDTTQHGPLSSIGHFTVYLVPRGTLNCTQSQAGVLHSYQRHAVVEDGRGQSSYCSGNCFSLCV